MISETQIIVRIISSQTGIDRRIGGIPELKPNTMTLEDRRGNPTDLEVKVLVIIAGLIVGTEVVNLIIDSIITAVDRVVRGTVLSGLECSKWVFKLLSDRGESGGDPSQNTANPPDIERRTIRISSLRIVDLPYVPVHLTQEQKNHLYPKRSMDRVVTAQGRVELQIRDFQKPGISYS
ncbi:hypothetical protein TNCV_2711891 [Trichonephila clavipes]|nr:hypothetical protein TNCV_2711891 [Trichonephila clavipes]